MYYVQQLFEYYVIIRNIALKHAMYQIFQEGKLDFILVGTLWKYFLFRNSTVPSAYYLLWMYA